MKIFGALMIRLDPWQVDYGAELQLDEGEDTGQDEGVALDVELPSGEWRPISPGGTMRPAQMVFVDGVRRIEARLIIRREGRVSHGAFGSHAVGAVRVAEGAASWAVPRVGRLVVMGSGETIDGPIAVTPDLIYNPISKFDTDPDAPLRAIQEQMRIEEEWLGKELADSEDTLVIADGPVTFQEASRGAVLGYIKRIFKLYLPQEHLGLLARLATGERTPVFALRSSRRFVRFSWLLRLAAPQPGDSELAGIARLEVSETVGAEIARRLADASAGLLPRFVPGRWRDPRSPQNLLPIGALETSLRRHLGDGRLMRRCEFGVVSTAGHDGLLTQHPADQIALGSGAGEAVDFPTAQSEDDRRDAAHAELLGQRRLLIDVDLDKADPRFEPSCGALEGGSHGVGRPAPRRPEIDQQRNVALSEMPREAGPVERDGPALEQ
jgi:hypothetical protein